MNLVLKKYDSIRFAVIRYLVYLISDAYLVYLQMRKLPEIFGSPSDIVHNLSNIVILFLKVHQTMKSTLAMSH